MIGDNIRRERIRKGMTVPQLAAKLVDSGYKAISDATLSRWERCQHAVPSQALRYIARALHCSIITIIYGADQVQDQQVVFDDTNINQHQAEGIRWIQREWQGNAITLIQFDMLYAVLPPSIRQEIAYTGIRLYKDAKSKGLIPKDAPQINIGAIIRGWKELTTK